MPAPAWENLDDFLDLDDFAVTATIKPKDGGPTRTVAGIFDNPYMDAKLGEYDFDTAKPRFLGKETDLAGVLRYDLVVVNGVEYEVQTGAQSTGDGMAQLVLAK